MRAAEDGRITGHSDTAFSAYGRLPTAGIETILECWRGIIRRSNMSRTQGCVRWFNREKGFGLICGADGRNVFVDHSAIATEGIGTLKEGDTVDFDWEPGSYVPMATNVNVRPLEGIRADGVPLEKAPQGLVLGTPSRSYG
jgi:CspA family cold shock protein